MASREQTRERYIREFPYFEAAANQAGVDLDNALQGLGMRGYHIKVRAKEISSFVKKLRHYKKSFWQQTTDKVGAQVVVHTLADVRHLRSALESGLPRLRYLRTKDMSTYLGDPKQLRYSGIHIQVALEGAHTSKGEQIECEIQLRTQAQDVWAYLEHGFIYKPVIDPSPEVARKIARLSVLVEMFDEEVDSVNDRLAQDPRYASALLLHEAERLFHTFVSVPGESDLSLEVIAVVADAIPEDERGGYAEHLATFVSDHHDQIESAFRDYGPHTRYAEDFNYLLFSQPESLILWERIENQGHTLEGLVRNTELAEPVHALADVWGKPLERE